MSSSVQTVGADAKKCLPDGTEWELWLETAVLIEPNVTRICPAQPNPVPALEGSGIEPCGMMAEAIRVAEITPMHRPPVRPEADYANAHG
jgi:hypothetical protein